MIAAACLFVLAIVAATPLLAAEKTSRADLAGVTSRDPSPIEDDANLHDIQFVDSRHGWAVGDHGVIWRSDDAGETWTLQPSGVNCPLRSVCFLSDLVGWVAGGGTVPFTRRSYGVILYTIDGGRSWENLAAAPSSGGKDAARPKSSAKTASVEKKPSIGKPSLPRIRKIKFFTPDDGVIVGEGTGVEPAGAYATDDAGRTWRALPGKAAPGWLGADFFNPDAGVLVGVNDSLALAVEGKVVVPTRFERFGVRGRHAVALLADRGGWLVGDGGLVRWAENEGLIWQDPPSPLPRGCRDTFDFRSVCCRGDKVWLAGNPGSTIWHSPDAGRNWIKQRTGQSIPLARVQFTTDQRGWGVGALGTMLRTNDGGTTWKAVRGGGRRAALMTLVGRGRQVSLGLIAELSGEAGYRSVVSVVAHEDDDEGGVNEAEWSDRFHEAVTTTGGSAAQVGWQLPLVIPGLERDFDRLVADWNRRTENRLDEILVGAMVRQIRTWRPNVLVIEQPEANDAVARLIGEAAHKAVEQAADATAFLEHQELAGLEPWQVQKIFVKLPEGSSGQVNVDPFQYLPHKGATTSMVAATARGLFVEHNEVSLHREAYRLVSDRQTDDRPPSFAGGLFAGISLAPGSAARRPWTLVDDTGLAARLNGIRKQRDFAAVSKKVIDEERQAGALIARLPEISRGLPAAEAAWQLMHLAEQYQAAGEWEWAELTLIELCEKYPDEPAGRRAMQRLVQSWGSGEITWRRLKKAATEQGIYQNDPQTSVPAAIEFVEARFQKQASGAQRT
ncbi:MAG TPA: YCF48-related protein, partial [Planctomycetaceae bacterium]